MSAFYQFIELLGCISFYKICINLDLQFKILFAIILQLESFNCILGWFALGLFCQFPFRTINGNTVASKEYPKGSKGIQAGYIHLFRIRIIFINQKGFNTANKRHISIVPIIIIQHFLQR